MDAIFRDRNDTETPISRFIRDNMGTVGTPETFEAHRACSSWNSLDQHEGHEFARMPQLSLGDRRGPRQSSIREAMSARFQTTCMDCHKGIAHKLPNG